MVQIKIRVKAWARVANTVPVHVRDRFSQVAVQAHDRLCRLIIRNLGVLACYKGVGQAENSPRRPRTAYSAEALVEDDRSPIYAYIART